MRTILECSECKKPGVVKASWTKNSIGVHEKSCHVACETNGCDHEFGFMVDHKVEDNAVCFWNVIQRQKGEK